MSCLGPQSFQVVEAGLSLRAAGLVWWVCGTIRTPTAARKVYPVLASCSYSLLAITESAYVVERVAQQADQELIRVVISGHSMVVNTFIAYGAYGPLSVFTAVRTSPQMSSTVR